MYVRLGYVGLSKESAKTFNYKAIKVPYFTFISCPLDRFPPSSECKF